MVDSPSNINLSAVFGSLDLSQLSPDQRAQLESQFQAALSNTEGGGSSFNQPAPDFTPTGNPDFIPASSGFDTNKLLQLDVGKDGLTFEDFKTFKFSAEEAAAGGDKEAFTLLNTIGDMIGSEHPQSFAEEEAMNFIAAQDKNGDGALSSEELAQLSFSYENPPAPADGNNDSWGTWDENSLQKQNMNMQLVIEEDEAPPGAPKDTPPASHAIKNDSIANRDTPADTSKPQHTEFIADGITSTEKSGGKAAIDGGGPNTINLINTTDKPMEVAFFRNFAPYEPNHIYADGIFTLQPGEKLDVSMPDEWQGRVQKWNGTTQNFANWAEINFESATDLIWFNESDIPGRNSAMRITSGDGQVGGSLESILDKAPKDLLVQDSSGEWVLRAPEWFTGDFSQGSVDFLNEHLGTQNAYVLPPDHDAVRRSQSDTLSIEFGKA